MSLSSEHSHKFCSHFTFTIENWKWKATVKCFKHKSAATQKNRLNLHHAAMQRKHHIYAVKEILPRRASCQLRGFVCVQWQWPRRRISIHQQPHCIYSYALAPVFWSSRENTAYYFYNFHEQTKQLLSLIHKHEKWMKRKTVKERIKKKKKRRRLDTHHKCDELE